MGTSQSVYTPRKNRNHSLRNRRNPHDEYHHEQFRNPEFRGGDEHTARRRDEDYAARRREEDYVARRPDRDGSRREGFERRQVDYQGYRDVEDDARSHLVQNRVDRARMYRQDQGRHLMATGPIYFSERIRSTPIPPHFRIAQGGEKYRGDAKPQTWLDDYRIAVQIGGGGDEIAMMHLPLMLGGSARTWLNQLPPRSIWVWEDLVRVFVKNFEGTYKRPGGLTELQLCIQGNTEPTREYIQRWITLHNSVEGVSEFQAIHAFKKGVKYKELSLKLAKSPDVTSLGRLMEIANKYANGEEEIRQKSQHYGGGGNNGSSNPRQKNGGGSGKRKAEGAPTDAELVAAANAAGIHGKGQPRKEWQPRQKKPTNDDDILDQPCPLHTTRDAEGKTVLLKHTARQCRLIKRAAQNAKIGSQQDKGNKKEGSPDLDNEGFPREDGVLVIFAGRETKRVEKLRFREVNIAAPAVPSYMKWVDVPITFDKSDHPPHIPHPGRHALIVDPLVETEKGNFRLRNVLMDGGSGINILYASTLKSMNIPMSKLNKSYLEFHDTIPGKRHTHSK